MRLALKTWISNGEDVRATSLLGVADADNPDMLPTILASGHWQEFRMIGESDFKLADEARNASLKNEFCIFNAWVYVPALVAD